MGEQFRIDVAVTRGDQQIHGAEAVVGTHQIELPVERQIAEMDGSKFSERDEASDRLVIFSQVDAGLCGEVRAIGIRRRLTLQRSLDHLCGRRHHAPIHAGHRDLIAGLRDGVLRLGVQIAIPALEKRICGRVGLSIGTVVDELLDGNASGKLSETADVIAVVVRRDQVIDLREARVLACGKNPFCIPHGRGATVP